MLLASWLSMLGFDFFLHGGLLAGLWARPSPFLLAPADLFGRIPLGYLSLLLWGALLLWLMLRLRLVGWRQGLGFGLKLGSLALAAQLIGLLSAASAEPALLAGWFAGQTVELGLAGAVAGSGLAATRLGPLYVRVVAFVLVLAFLTVVLQVAGLAPATRR